MFNRYEVIQLLKAYRYKVRIHTNIYRIEVIQEIILLNYLFFGLSIHNLR